MNLGKGGSVPVGIPLVLFLSLYFISAHPALSEGRVLSSSAEGPDNHLFSSKTLPKNPPVEGIAVKDENIFEARDISDSELDDTHEYATSQVHPVEILMPDIFHGIASLFSSFLSLLTFEKREPIPQKPVPDYETDSMLTDFKIRVVNNTHSPYHVSIQDENGRLKCSGAIINNTKIVTAASCFTRNSTQFRPPAGYRVVAGVSILKTSATYLPPQTMGIELVIPHPEYNLDISHEHDLAVLILNDSYVWRDYLRRIPRATHFFPKSKKGERRANVSGWTDYGRERYQLRRANVSIYSNERCAQFLPVGVNPANFLCTDKLESGDETDIGRPVVLTKRNRHLTQDVLVGISVRTDGSTLISTSITAHRDWLQNMTLV